MTTAVVDAAAVKISFLVASVMNDGAGENDEAENEIPLPLVRAEILKMVVEFCEHYAKDPMNDISTIRKNQLQLYFFKKHLRPILTAPPPLRPFPSLRLLFATPQKFRNIRPRSGMIRGIHRPSQKIPKDPVRSHPGGQLHGGRAAARAGLFGRQFHDEGADHRGDLCDVQHYQRSDRGGDAGNNKKERLDGRALKTGCFSVSYFVPRCSPSVRRWRLLPTRIISVRAPIKLYFSNLFIFICSCTIHTRLCIFSGDKPCCRVGLPARRTCGCRVPKSVQFIPPDTQNYKSLLKREVVWKKSLARP